MVYNKFKIQILVRLILLLLTMMLLSAIVFLLSNKHLFFLTIIIAFLILFQSILLFKYLTKTNRELYRFFESIRLKEYGEKPISIPSNFYTQNFKYQIDKILDSFHELKVKDQANLYFLQYLIDSIPFGILVLENNNNILFQNTYLLEFFNLRKDLKWTDLISRFQEFNRINLQQKTATYLIESNINDIVYQLDIQQKTLIVLDKEYKVLTFQNIKSQIDKKETEAWHKLTRVLTHEIMNSVTPLTSLADTIYFVLTNSENSSKKITDITEENLNDVITSIETIKSRSKNLLHFVNDFRKLTKVPEPKLQSIDANTLIQNTVNLLKAEFDNHSIKINIPPENTSFNINIDIPLLEQVLINLLTNSIQALGKSDNKQIDILFKEVNSLKQIIIKDNGSGIQQENLANIFIPFYSTKENGSGIGLSLSKHIMELHNGDIQVHSLPGKETSFILFFRE